MKPDKQGVDAEGAGIKDAIAEFMADVFEMDMAPMVGGFTLVAEIIDPATGQIHATAIQDRELPLWNEYGLLALRLNEIVQEWEAGNDE